MDKVSLVKSQLKLEHWKRVISECQASGIQGKQWCLQNNVSKDQYYYWLRKVREMTVETLSLSDGSLPATEDVSFRRLEVKTPARGFAPAVIIHLPQATVEVPEGMSQSMAECF